MKIENLTLHDTNHLQGLVDFVLGQMPDAAATARVVIKDKDHGSVDGLTHWVDPLSTYSRGHQSLVEVFIGPYQQYPMVQEYVPGIIFVAVNLDEMLIATIAHELQHAVQALEADGVPPLDIVSLEIEAELVAVNVLGSWRAHRRDLYSITSNAA